MIAHQCNAELKQVVAAMSCSSPFSNALDGRQQQADK
jgi:hypothetical protein